MMCRLHATIAALAGLTSAALVAQPLPAPPADDLLAAALEAEIAALSSISWTASATAATAFGWRDNALLSTFSPVRRGFGRAEFEASLLRPQRRGWQFVGFLNGELLRYFSPPSELAGEEQWELHSEFRWAPTERLRADVKAVGYWQDTVIDQSESEQLRFVAPTRVCGGFVALTPGVRVARLRVEPWLQLRRNDYRGYNGDCDEPKHGIRLEWPGTRRLALSAGWSELHRRFDHRIRYTAGGRPLPGTRLRFRQREATLALRATLGGKGDGSLGISGTRLENTDEASGYFDYLQRRLSLELEWRHAPWRIAAWLEGGRTDYRLQTVGAGTAPPARIADDYETVLRVERSLGAGWSLFAERYWERSRSNLPGVGYRANTVQAGVRREL